ncbi:MAG TPA: ABC transporter permease [Thermomicrobiales bacterium]|nr:ABC transporter permease [Thermomicrobiales bacterium]
MWKFIVRRMIVAIPVLFVISVLDFGFIALAPGDPLQAMLPQGDADMGGVTEQVYDDTGLSDSIPVRYIRWVGEVAQGNFGTSFRTGEPAIEAIASAVPNTVKLTLSAAVIAIMIGIPLGIVAALREGSLLDELLTLFSYTIASIPGFFLALIAVFVAAVKYHIFPATGASSIGSDTGFLDSLHHLILPATVLGILQTPGYIRHLRGSVLETMREDYVRTARAKGLNESVVVVRHVLRNALMPVVTIMGLQIPVLVGGSVLIEQVFAWPGLGTLSIQSALFRDYPVFMGTALLYAVAVLISSTVTDIAYAIVNPRVRYA